MSHSIRLMVAGALAAAAVVVATSSVGVAQAEKVYVCHATGSEGNPFVAIRIPDPTAGFPHLNSNGSPLSGHEQDFLSYTRECDPHHH